MAGVVLKRKTCSHDVLIVVAYKRLRFNLKTFRSIKILEHYSINKGSFNRNLYILFNYDENLVYFGHLSSGSYFFIVSLFAC